MKWYQMQWAQKYWGKDAAKRYQQYLQSDAWKEKRNAILKAAGYRCRKCGERATEVHHETYRRIYKEKLTDLTALCRKCHETVHTAPKQKSKKKSSQKARQHPYYRKGKPQYKWKRSVGNSK